jgi:hypothetical protein
MDMMQGYKSVEISTFICGAVVILSSLNALFYIVRMVSKEKQNLAPSEGSSGKIQRYHLSYLPVYAVLVLIMLQWSF